jgi:hypothetical protein
VQLLLIDRESARARERERDRQSLGERREDSSERIIRGAGMPRHDGLAPEPGQSEIEPEPEPEPVSMMYIVEVLKENGHTRKELWINHDEVVRVESKLWHCLVVFLAFLDWFHIAFNLTNLINMLTNNRWSASSGYSAAKERLLVGLCYLCISIYSIRIIAQPVLLAWRGHPLTSSTFVYKVLTGVDLMVGVFLMAIGGFVLPIKSELQGITITLIVVGAATFVSACLGAWSLRLEDTGCRHKTSNMMHILIGLFELICGIAVAIQRDELVEKIGDLSGSFSSSR